MPRPAVVGRTFESLASPQFRLLWAGMLIMMAGMQMQMLARSQLAWDLTGSSFLVAVVGAGFGPPILIFSLFGGAVADRFERKNIIQIGQFGMAILTGCIAVLILTNLISIWHLIVAALLQGVLFAFMMPARQAIIPSLVEERQVSNAVAINASGMSLMTAGAPAVAGFIYAAGGPEAAYFTICGMNIAAFVLTSFLRPTENAVARVRKRMWKDVKEGLAYTRQNRTVMMLLLLALTTSVLAMPIRQLLPVQIEEVFHREVGSLGIMLSMVGVGALVGSLTIAGMKRDQHMGLVLLATTMVSGVSILLAGLNSAFFIALFIMVLVGLGDSGRRSLNQSLILERSDAPYRGRVMGVYMMNFGLTPLGALPMGAIGEWIGIQWAFAIAGALLIFTTVLMTFGTRRIRAL